VRLLVVQGLLDKAMQEVLLVETLVAVAVERELLVGMELQALLAATVV
jgi:hypothetical protein